MTHSELYNRFQNIQTSKNNLKTEIINYIICTLKNNEDFIESINKDVHIDRLEQDFPFFIKVEGQTMHLMGVCLKEENIQVKVYDEEQLCVHNLFLEKDNIDNLESTAAFINQTLEEIGENNLYSLLVIYNMNNSRKITPSILKGLDDAEIWVKLMGLKNYEMNVFQMKGPKMKFMDFSQFIAQMNEDGMSGQYAVQLHLKEKYL